MNLSRGYGTLPTDETFLAIAEKERHVQFRLVRALNDADLVRKLLMLKLDAPTSEMLSICQTHSALDTGLTEMGLREKKVNAVQKTAGRRRQQPPKGQCGNCTKKHPSGWDNCPARDATCHGCGNKGHWKTKCRKSQKADKGQTSRRPQHPKKPNTLQELWYFVRLAIDLSKLLAYLTLESMGK